MRYRLLCCADTHGRLPPALSEDGAVAWLHAGDVTHGPTAVDDDSDPFADPLRAGVARWFTNRAVPVFVVRGNHDVTDDFGAFRSATDLTGRVVPIAPRLFVAGIGWRGERYFELPLESDLQPVCDAVQRQARRLVMPNDRLVLLTHYPPRYPENYEVQGDKDGGGTWFNCIRRLIEDLRPLVVIPGHVHKWAGTSREVLDGAHRTLIVHPGRAGAVVTVDVERGSATHEWVE